jgi:two-component system chemotaxis response regulator CheB
VSAEPHLVAVTLVVIGASWGGLRALEIVLGGLPAGFGAPVVVAQHRQPGARELLAGLLDAHTALDVRDARDHDALLAGRVLVAPADRHLLVEGDHVELSSEPEVRHSRPSIDVLFESAARTHGRGTVGVVLTGANDDGARGLQAVRAGGGHAIVQDPAGAEASRMPAAALARAGTDDLLALADVAPRIVALAEARA